MSSLKDTIEKIRRLEMEKRNLIIEIGELKKVADAKAFALENEVAALRDELAALKNLISGPDSSFDQRFKKITTSKRLETDTY